MAARGRGGVYLDTRTLDRIVARMPGRAERLVAELASDVANGARVNTVRIETGTMRRGWLAQRLDRLRWRVGNAVPYTVFHEFGTSVLSPSPMLGPALEDGRRTLRDRVRGLFRP